MKILVIHLTGNCGKTTINTHLLSPRFPGYRIITLETQNTGTVLVDAIPMAAKSFDAVMDELIMNKNILIDVGASNVAATFKGLLEYEGAHHEIDYYLVPVTKDEKIQKDTINTVATLAKQKVPAHKIRLIFNRVESTDTSDLKSEFSTILSYVATEKNCIADLSAAISESPLFERLEEAGYTINEILALDEAKIRIDITDSTGKTKSDAVNILKIQMLAKGVQCNLDKAFAALKLGA